MTRPSTISQWARPVRGFTLIELAIAVFVIILLLGSLLVPLTTQVEQRQISDTQKTLDVIKDAIIGYAVANGYLPCPDLTSGAGANDGQEDFGAGSCTNTLGNVPWVTLGVADRDLWGRRFRYRVSADFAQRAPLATFSFTSSSDVRVCANSACTTTLTLSSPNGAVAIILSHGKNGYLGIAADTGSAIACPGGGCSADESQNSGGSTYVSRAITPLGATAGEFDDIAIWIPRHLLFDRMVAAGKLP